jgi:dual specificity tyrosine-phosphorylation-regulated kinase 2/3/4
MTAPDPTPSKTSSSHLTSQTRRKSSTGNATVTTQHDRNKSDSSWSSPKTEKKPEKAAVPKTASSSILSPMSKMLGSKGSLSQLRSSRNQPTNTDPNMDHDDLLAEEEMRRIASRKKNLDQAATQMDDLKRRAFSKDRMSPQQVLRMGVLNIFEKGEIVDYKDVYFTGAKDAKKHVGDLKNTNLPNFGYDDERGDYAIVKGDHLAYRYEIIDVLGKGSFGQVVRCIDHRSGGLVAIKIIRNKKRFHQQALVEVNILQKLKEWVSSLHLLTNTS